MARVNATSITVADFKRAYLPVLLYSDQKERLQTREEVLNFLIDQTLLSQAARAAALDTVPILKVLRRTAQKTAFTRILYREWVKAPLKNPSDTELREAFRRSHDSRLVRHLFTRDSLTAVRLYEQVSLGANWDSLAALIFQDSSLAANGGVLGWMKFGDMDPDFEAAAYQLRTGEISHPVRTRFGWHILRVDAEHRELMLTEYDYNVERRGLERIIRERREQTAADSVINRLMQQANLRFNPEIAPQVWTVIATQIDALLNPGDLQEIPAQEVQSFEKQLAPLLHEELLRFDDQVWDVATLLQKLPEMNRQLMLTDIKKATGFLVRDELIYQAGLQRGLDQTPIVQGEVRDRENQYLANLFLRRAVADHPLSDQAVVSYYHDHAATRYQAPDSLRILELQFPDLQQAKDFKSSVQDKFSPASLSKTSPDYKLVDLGWLQGAGTERTDYYHRLVDQPSHTLVGPLTGFHGVVLITASQRRRHLLPLQQVQSRVRQDAENDRIQKLRLHEVQRLSAQARITIDRNRLQQLELGN